MKILLIIITLMLYSAPIDLFSQQNYVIGERKEVYSKILSEERSFNLYLPSDYQKSGARYPLLVVLDGYFLWTTGIVDYLAFSGNIPPLIIVAINNTDRDRDFTPTHSNNLEGEEVPTSGGARNFLRFIGEELLPLIDSTYRTEPFRLLVGHSLGALFVTFAMLENPELFQAHIACSPTLPWDNESIVKYSMQKLLKEYPRNIFYYLIMDEQTGAMLNSSGNFIEEIKKSKPQEPTLEIYPLRKLRSYLVLFYWLLQCAPRSIYAF